MSYVTPADKLAGLDLEIFAERDREREEARDHRAMAGHAAREAAQGAPWRCVDDGLGGGQDSAEEYPQAPPPGAKTGAGAGRGCSALAPLPTLRSAKAPGLEQTRQTFAAGAATSGTTCPHPSYTPAGTDSSSR